MTEKANSLTTRSREDRRADALTGADLANLVNESGAPLRRGAERDASDFDGTSALSPA
jgi:hypothetical protein